jgi:hypothetical protein
MNDDEMREVYALWNKDEPNGHLAEITSHVFSKPDGKTGRRQIDKILAGVKQKARNIQLLENSGHRRWRHAGGRCRPPATSRELNFRPSQN